jgi:N-methylhydantoinase B
MVVPGTESEGEEEMVTVDAFTREIIKHKLYGVVDEGFIALENISGTAVVAEGHDTIVALYTPDGRLLYSGAGVLHHVPCAAQAVRGVIDYFTENGEIAENDVFMMNDPYAGALHAPDVFIIQPIHAAGQLVAFVASFLHVSDIGSIDPGGFCTSATECYHEGFQTKGLKLVERGKLRQDVWDTIMNMTRVPKQVAMDYKSQIAAGFVAKQRMIAVVEKYGLETVRTVCEELMQQSEQSFRQRLLEIPDGVYRTRKYFDLGDKVYRIELAAAKEQDSLTFDLTGTAAQVAFGINACKWGAWGGLFPAVFTLLAWDITWNDGILRCVRFVAPEGTLVNCQRPAPTSLSSIGVITMLNQMGTNVVSKMLGTTEQYKHRATADWLGVHEVEAIAGVLPNGEYTVGLGTESFAGAGGGRASKDGVDNEGDITICLAHQDLESE